MDNGIEVYLRDLIFLHDSSDRNSNLNFFYKNYTLIQSEKNSNTFCPFMF